MVSDFRQDPVIAQLHLLQTSFQITTNTEVTSAV